MSATLYKYCPLCGHANAAIASFCEACDGDLMNAPAEASRTDIPSIAESRVTTPAHAGSTSAVAVSSAAAQGNATDAMRGGQGDVGTRRADLPAAAVLHLELVENPAIHFSVRAGQSVGRSERADVILTGVPGIEFISRAHARFSQRRTQWYVQYIAEGNSITVDGVESKDDAEMAIHEGSVVVFSYTPFRVKLS